MARACPGERLALLTRVAAQAGTVGEGTLAGTSEDDGTRSGVAGVDGVAYALLRARRAKSLCIR